MFSRERMLLYDITCDRAILHECRSHCKRNIQLDFPYGFWPTIQVDIFRDFLPAPQGCKSFFVFFSSPPSVFSGTGSASLTFAPFHTLFHAI